MMHFLLRWLVLLASLFSVSCGGIRSYDSLVYYRPGYDPHYGPQLRTDGFYYRIEPVRCGSTGEYVDHYRPLYFYPDGSFAIGVMHPSLESLRYWNDHRGAGGCTWGFYSLSHGVVMIEMIDRSTGMSSCIAERNTMEARIEGERLTVYSFKDRRGRERLREPERFEFMVFDGNPDVSLNWLKTHPKYTLEKSGNRTETGGTLP